MSKRKFKHDDIRSKLSVATLNLCGGSFNPLEFLNLGCKDFMKNYKQLEAVAYDMLFRDMMPYMQPELVAKYCIDEFQKLGRGANAVSSTLPVMKTMPVASASASTEGGGGTASAPAASFTSTSAAMAASTETDAAASASAGTTSEGAASGDGISDAWLSLKLWPVFTEDVLQHSSKLLTLRINMIDLAMQASSDVCCPGKGTVWEWVTDSSNNCNSSGEAEKKATGKEPWFLAMAKLSHDETYKAAPELFVYDLACNIIAVTYPRALDRICADSYLAPTNYVKCVNRFLDAAAGADVIVFQEFPQGDNRAAFTAQLRGRGYGLTLGNISVAVAAQDALGPVTIVSGVDVKPAEIMRDVLEESVGRGLHLDDRTRSQFIRTTASKTLMVRVGGVTVIVTHAKEPRTVAGAETLGCYFKRLVEADTANGGTGQWVILSDTNIATAGRSSAFENAVGTEMQVAPTWDRITTSKHRSLLHGQTYHAEKVFVTVRACKDRLLAPAGCLNNVCIFPDLSDAQSTLPTSAWASDHCIVQADCNFTAMAELGDATDPAAKRTKH